MQDISNAIREGAEAFMATAVPRHRHHGHRHRHRPLRRLLHALAASCHQDRLCLPRRRGLLGSLGLHRDVRLHPRQHPYRSRRTPQHEPRAPYRSPWRRSHRPRRGCTLPRRSRRSLPGLWGTGQSPGRRLSTRRLRLRRIADRALCPARRRHLYQGRGCRRRPRRQGGGRHTRRRPAQPGRHRRPRRRQRGRLRRPRRGHLRVHRSGERRRHDPGRNLIPGLWHQGHPLSAHRASPST